MSEELEKRYGVEVIRRIIETQAPGVAPLPSRVEGQLLAIERVEAARARRKEAQRQVPASRRIEGEDQLKALMQNRWPNTGSVMIR